MGAIPVETMSTLGCMFW